jgi:hypothetical protein
VSGRGFLKALVALVGVALGVVAVVVVASVIGLLPASGSVGSTPRTTSTVAVVATSVPTPTPPPGVVEINGIGDAQRRAASLRGKQVRVTIGETELAQLASDYLRQQGIDVSNVQVRLHPGQLVMTGTAKQGIVSVNFTVTGHPIVSNGSLKLQIDSVEPAVLAQVAKVAPGQTIDIPLSGFQAQSAEVVEGQLIVTGTAK